MVCKEWTNTDYLVSTTPLWNLFVVPSSFPPTLHRDVWLLIISVLSLDSAHPLPRAFLPFYLSPSFRWATARLYFFCRPYGNTGFTAVIVRCLCSGLFLTLCVCVSLSPGKTWRHLRCVGFLWLKSKRPFKDLTWRTRTLALSGRNTLERSLTLDLDR